MYEALTKQSVLKPSLGLPAFSLAFAIALFGQPLVGGVISGLSGLFSVLLFPYYIAQLFAKRFPVLGQNGRAFVAVYLLVFVATAGFFLTVDAWSAKA